MTVFLRRAGRAAAGLLSLVIILGLLAPALAAQQETVTLGIYATSGMAGRYYERNPITGEAESVSYLKVAAAMTRERTEMDQVLLFDVGGALPTGLQAGLIDGAEGTVAKAIRGAGYQGLIPGTGEFAYPAKVRDGFFSALSAHAEEGTPVSVLSANYLTEKNQNPVLAPYEVYQVPVGEQTFRVGVLGLNGTDTAARAPQGYLTDSVFAHRENKTGDLALEWSEHWQQRLRTTEKCDLVVVALPVDGVELQRFVAATDGIDLILSGDSAGASGVLLKNAAGQEVPCTGGGGVYMSKTAVTIAENGTFTIGDSVLLPLSEERADPGLSKALLPSAQALGAAAARPVGTLSGDWTDNERYGSTRGKTVALVGSAMMWAAQADVALVSGDWMGERVASDLFAAQQNRAEITLRNCGEIYTGLDSDLCLVELSGGQLRLLLEQGADAYEITETAAVSGGRAADQLYGADYELYLGNKPGEKVLGLQIGGSFVPEHQVLRVAMEYSRLQDSPFAQGEYKVLWHASGDSAWAASGGTVSSVLAGYLRYQTDQVGYVAPPAENRWYVYGGASGAAITRLEFISMLHELAGAPTPSTDMAFVDVKDSAAAVWAAENRIANGDGRGNFLPGQPVTKEQASVMFYNFVRGMELKTIQAESAAKALLDYGEIALWARPAVDFCYQTGVVPGGGLRNDVFLPREHLTREAARAAMQRFGGLLGLDTMR